MTSDLAASTPADAGRLRALALCVASLAVVGVSVMIGFRQAFAEDPALLWQLHGARTMLGLGAGIALGIGGALRLEADRESAHAPVIDFATAAGGALGVVLATGWIGASIPAAIAGGALVALGSRAAASVAAPDRRGANLIALLWIAFGIAIGLMMDFQARASDAVAAQVAGWFLARPLPTPMFTGALLLAGGLALLAAAVALRERAQTLAILSTAFGFGALGILAFVGSLIPRAVGALLPGTARGPGLVAAALATGAGVVALEAGLSVVGGGYAVPLSIGAALVSLPIFGIWNARRLAAVHGRGPGWLIALEAVLIGAGLFLIGVIAFAVPGVIARLT